MLVQYRSPQGPGCAFTPSSAERDSAEVSSAGLKELATCEARGGGAASATVAAMTKTVVNSKRMNVPGMFPVFNAEQPAFITFGRVKLSRHEIPGAAGRST